MALIKKNILLLFIKNISINLKFTLILKQIKTLSWFPESILGLGTVPTLPNGNVAMVL